MTAKGKRLLGTLTAIAVVGLAAFAAVLLVQHALAKRRLAAAIEQLDRIDPNWRLDAASSRHAASLTDDKNLAAHLPAVLSEFVELSDELGERRADLWAGLVPNVRLSPRQWQIVIDIVETNEAAILPALDLENYPRGRHGITFTPSGSDVNMRALFDLSTAANVLTYVHFAAVQRGDTATSLQCIRGTLNLGRSLRDEPNVNAASSRAGLRQHTVRALERTLGHGVLTADQLAIVARELRSELADDLLLKGLRGEVTLLDVRMTAVRTGAVKWSMLRTFGPLVARSRAQGLRDHYGDWWKDHLGTAPVAEHAELLEIGALAIAAAKRPWPERWPAAAVLPRPDDVTRPEVVRWQMQDYTSPFAYYAFDECRLRCGLACAAAEDYRLRHGDWPATLDALGPLPDDPFTGQPLKLRRRTDGIVIYSVGPDLVDDGGELADVEPMPTRPHTDFGFRLWDVPHRNRPPGAAP